MAVTVGAVYQFLDHIAPYATCEPWDNCGLQIGDTDAVVNRIGVVLDITPAVVERAKQDGIPLLVSHHSVLFRAQKQFLAQDLAWQLARAGIHVISAHTNLDAAPGGVNDALADALGLRDVTPLPLQQTAQPLLRVGTLPCEPLSPERFAAYVEEKLRPKTSVRSPVSGAALQWCKGEAHAIRRVALCGGGGGEFCEAVLVHGADAYVVGEAKYHEFLDAARLGLTMVAAGHFQTEYPIVAVLAAKLREAFAPAAVVEL